MPHRQSIYYQIFILLLFTAISSCGNNNSNFKDTRSKDKPKNTHDRHSRKKIDITSNLIGHYEFEENAIDSSKSLNHGVEKGGVEYSEGKFGKAAKFNGSTSYIEIADNPSLIINNKVSVCAWVKIASRTGTCQRILTKWSINNREKNQREYTLSFDGPLHHDGEDKFSMSFDKISLRTNTEIDDGNWHHAAFTYDGSVCIIYLDGKELSRQNAEFSAPDGDTPLFIGGGASSTPMPSFILNGLIDDVKIYKRALSKAEIEYLFNN